MKLFALTFLVALTQAKKFYPYHNALSNEIIDYVNNKVNTTWKAGPAFQGMSIHYVKGLCGVIKDPNERKLKEFVHEVESLQIPESFDSRKKWSSCPSLEELRDQGNCGSCWAAAASAAMTDRICIKSSGKVSAHISIENLMTCCFTCGAGCNGGFPEAAWKYFEQTGIVTGGVYGSHKGCQPYEIKPCEHHVNGTRKPCTGIEHTPHCHKTCESGYKLGYDEDKHYGVTAYSIPNDVKQIQTEIMTNGPVEAAFTVYSDFPTYKSGVYQHESGVELGGHAVKMIGWGIEAGTPYWLIANSWNSDWGDHGYFKIKRGNDECGIESQITAGIPKV